MFKYKFGVEIEFNNRLKNNELFDADSFDEIQNKLGLNWKIIRDGSCGYEAVSPILEMKDLWQISKICEALKKEGAMTDNRCGLHVHMDARDLTLRHLRSILAYWSATEESIFDPLTTLDRRDNNNNFCNSSIYTEEFIFSKASIRELAESFPDRYRKLNIKSYLDHGTLEFRSFGGTLNDKEIINWVNLLQLFFEYCSYQQPRSASLFYQLTGENQIVAIEKCIKKKNQSNLDRTKLVDIKLKVYEYYGVSNTKDLRKAIDIPLDLRKKSSWLTLLQQTQRNNIVSFIAPIKPLSEWCRDRSLLMSA